MLIILNGSEQSNMGPNPIHIHPFEGKEGEKQWNVEESLYFCTRKKHDFLTWR